MLSAAALRRIGIDAKRELCSCRFGYSVAVAFGTVLPPTSRDCCFLRSTEQAGHAAGQPSLGIDQEVAVGHDLLSGSQSCQDRIEILRWCSGLYLSLRKLRRLSRLHQLARARIKHRRTGHNERLMFAGRNEFSANEHSGPETHARIWDMYMNRDGARLRIRFWLNEIDAAVENLVGQCIRSDLDRSARDGSAVLWNS